MLKQLDGKMFSNMVLCGAKFLEINREIVDSLNVFPVPDGDTGSNMFLTVSSAVKEVTAAGGEDLVTLATALSRGALKGARGNSGVILSQIFKGIANVIIEGKPVTTKVFAKAMILGTEIAYQAVTKPKEGTILTVIRVMAENAKIISGKTTDFVEFMQAVISKGEDILRQTPEMLPVLKKAGVVDAGGRGLLCIFKGFYNALAGIDIPDVAEIASDSGAGAVGFDSAPEIHDLGDIEFGYCTEFFVINLNGKTTESDIDKFREQLKTIGDCVLVIGDLNLVKVHVHTNDPGKAIQFALSLGEVDKVKIENMFQQNREMIAKREADKKPMGIISVCAGKGLSEIFKDLQVDYIIEGGQTMNPSVDDIVSAIKYVNAEKIFILPNNKNIILSAEQAKGLTDKTVYVIPTVDVPQGLAASLAFNPDEDAETNFENMKEAMTVPKSGSVTYSVRSVSLDGLDVKEGDIIGLNSKAIVVKGRKVSDVTSELIGKIVDENSQIITLYFGEGITEEDSNALVSKLSEQYPSCDVCAYFGGQPHYYYIISVE